jgi:hypothetical protein
VLYPTELRAPGKVGILTDLLKRLIFGIEGSFTPEEIYTDPENIACTWTYFYPQLLK